MKYHIFPLLVLSFLLLSTNANANHVCDETRFLNLGLEMKDFIYCDKSLSIDVRVKDLVGRMTLKEKVQNMGDDKDIQNGLSRIGLPSYNWWSEALHGVSFVGHGVTFDKEIPGATSFPVVLLMTAAFNKTLWNTVGKVVSTEARAMYNLNHAGLTFWSPNVNVVRDPRWGRAMETPGEDPFVVGTWGVNYVRGLQDVDGTENVTDLNTRPLKVAACCKHYSAYDLDSWHGVDRNHFDAKVTEQDMLETFQRPFEMCVKEGDVSSVMCSFNRVNGIPTCADPRLLKGIIRGEWGLNGYIVTDCDSIKVYMDFHKYLDDTHEDSVSQSLKAGVDLNCGRYYWDFLEDAVHQGLVRESELDKSLTNLYVVLMRLGYFDGIPMYENLGKQDVCSDAHIELAYEAAKEGIVLLKNDKATLPLNPHQFKNIAVIGPNAKATDAMIGNYQGVPCRFVSPVDGFSAITNVTYELGCDCVCRDDTYIFKAMNVAKNADATVLVVGMDSHFEAEWVDRNDLLLPGYQTQLINQVAEASTGPVILVIMSGGGVDISFAKDNPKIQGIFWSSYPGQEGGRAIADAVFGKFNPGGRLPLTWYPNNYIKQIPMTSMPLRPVDSLGYPGRTYKFYDGPTVYPFGYGLSYTNFGYQVPADPIISLNIKLDKLQLCHHVNYTTQADQFTDNSCPAILIEDSKCQDTFSFEVGVQNVGDKDGSEVVLVYSKAPEGIEGTHAKQLVEFERVFVRAGNTQNVTFTLNACNSLGIVDKSGYKLLPSGMHTIMLGDNSASLHVKVTFE